MNRVTKPAARTTMRVSAVFTGAAALAAAYTPAATAAAGTQTITFNNCTAGESHYVHLYFPPSAHHGPQCFGYDGYKTFSDAIWSKFCPGNNNGAIYGNTFYFTADGVAAKHFSYPFYAGEGTKVMDISTTFNSLTVSITGHTGNATCP
jgi:hypothetical protein